MIDKTSAYLLLPARWFPLTNFPSNRYTGTFKLIVPDSFVVVGTGQGRFPGGAAGTRAWRHGEIRICISLRQAGPVGSFVAGSLQLSPVQTEGLNTSVYTPPAQASTANSYATSLSHIVSYFSESFGGLERAFLDHRAIAGRHAAGIMRRRDCF